MTSSPDRELSHVDKDSHARMVNVSDKVATHRTAVAEAWVQVGPEIAACVKRTGGVKKGPVLSTAEIGGILGAKQTPYLIPMCHPLLLNDIQVRASVSANQGGIQHSTGLGYLSMMCRTFWSDIANTRT